MTTIDLTPPGRATELKPIVHHWSECVGAGRAHEGLRSSGQESLSLARRHCGFRSVRFHGLFHDDMGVYKQLGRGREAYSFLYIDDLFDRMLEQGVRPFVELGFCPRDMASRTDNCFWWKAHASPPWDPAAWERLVGTFVRHLVARYGQKEIAAWWFEVWNEPNLKPFWHGTKSQYFDLYARTARTIKAIDASFQVGGPATANFVPDDRFAGEVENYAVHLSDHADRDALQKAKWRGVWIAEFLDFCGKSKVPVDFVSTHPYPTDWALDQHGHGSNHTRSRDSIIDDLRSLKETIAQSPFPKAALHCTEWSSSPSTRDHMHDMLPPATYVVRSNVHALGLCDSLSYWTFTDLIEEPGTVPSTFHGGFGMLNYQQIAKPSFHAYALLNRLGTRLVSVADDHVITVTDAGDRVALAWNYPEVCSSAPPRITDDTAAALAFEQQGGSLEVTLNVPAATEVAVERLDTTSGHGRRLWMAMDCPEPPDRSRTAELRSRSQKLAADSLPAAATARPHRLSLPPWGIALITAKSRKV